jgi:D-tyrosyl-tRNA(Tyr) deacylase
MDMRIVLQRVLSASVTVDGAQIAEIGHGVVLLTGITHDDTAELAARMAKKIATLRIFPALDGPSGFDRSLLDVGGAVLVVSQFTLYGDTSGGRRPSFITAARPETAAPLIETLADQLRAHGLSVQTGRFGADMKVALVNDGPVTLVLE